MFLGLPIKRYFSTKDSTYIDLEKNPIFINNFKTFHVTRYFEKNLLEKLKSVNIGVEKLHLAIGLNCIESDLKVIH